ncbi:MAG: hypothetical protein ABI834_05080, partial [Ginsengibacter sp.]
MKRISIIFILGLLSYVSFSQQITYSLPESEDTRTLDFDIIGKVSGNFLVYKHIRNHYSIAIYDNSMKLKDNVDLDFMPDKTMNVDFVSYPGFSYIIYQFQRKNILHCMAAAINGNGEILKQPFELDTTYISFFADNKIYSSISSEDKSKVMIYKIQKKNDKFNFTTLLFNDSLQLLHKSRIETPYDEHKDIFSDFFVDNSGNFVFTKGTRLNSRDYLQKLMLVTKGVQEDNFTLNELNLSGNYLDEIKLKVDNVNKQYLINSLFYAKKNGNVEGLYTAVWDKGNDKLISQNFAHLSDSIRIQAKADGNSRFAFNDYFIRDVILKKDGGFILTAEDHSTQSRGNPWNRYDYLYGYPSFSPYDSYYLYSPSSYWYSGRFRNYYGNSQVRYFYENIVVLDLDNTGRLIWSNVIHKSQFDDDNDNFLSYNIILTGGEIHFLFNELERRNQLINDQTISPEGKVTRNPPLRSLDRGYEFMPRYAKQVSTYQIIVPCTYRNYI